MRCPGQDTRYWKPEDIFEAPCPQCGKTVEFFKDEPSRRCKHCGHRFVNPRMDFGCAAYCKFAEQCLGELPDELLAQRDELFKNRVAIAMKRYFNKDFRRIGHAANVARYAEQILHTEKGDPAVVLTAAYLHDIGIIEAEHRFGKEESGRHQELGAGIAREILQGLNAVPELIEEVCAIIAHHHTPGADETLNFKILSDADALVNLEEAHQENPLDQSKIEELISTRFLTGGGRDLAREVLLPADPP